MRGEGGGKREGERWKGRGGRRERQGGERGEMEGERDGGQREGRRERGKGGRDMREDKRERGVHSNVSDGITMKYGYDEGI